MVVCQQHWPLLSLTSFLIGVAIPLGQGWWTSQLHVVVGNLSTSRLQPYGAVALARPQQWRAMMVSPSAEMKAAAVPRMPTALSHPTSLTPPAITVHGPITVAMLHILSYLQTFAVTLGTTLLIGCAGAFRAVKPAKGVALLSATGSMDQAPPPRKPWKRILFRLLADIVLWITAYLWFFKGVHLVEALEHHNPALEVPTYIALSLLPLFCLKNHIFSSSVTRPLKALGTLSGSNVIKHFMLCAIRPIELLIKAVLVFFSSNLLLDAIPDGWTVHLPDHWKFLDPNGSMVLSAADFKLDFQVFAIQLLRCVAVTFFGKYLLSIKAAPEDHTEPTDREPNFVERYWTALKRRRGPPLLLDLFLDIGICVLVALRWMEFFHIKPEAVLTFGGVGGIALGLASQTVVGNLVSGLLLLVTQPFTVGDEVCTGKRQGVVQKIGWSSTVLQEKDGSLVLIPNRSIVGQETANLSLCSVRVLELTLPITISGGTGQCKPLLASVHELIASLPALKGLLLAKPRVLLKYSMATREHTPVITVEAQLDGSRVDSDYLEDLESEVFIALADHLSQAGAVMKGFGSK